MGNAEQPKIRAAADEPSPSPEGWVADLRAMAAAAREIRDCDQSGVRLARTQVWTDFEIRLEVEVKAV
jgi:hypothetical protein